MHERIQNMNQKVLLILCDGLRPDVITACHNPYGSVLLGLGSHTLTAQTVYPSVTLPCHMSLFHSVTPERHGILTNTYVPMSCPVRGLCEQLSACGKTCAFFYNWEELRDLTRPSSLSYSFFAAGGILGSEKTNEMVTENALSYIAVEKPDFAFVYLGDTDHAGHDCGWMSEEYLRSCSRSLDEIHRLIDAFCKEYTILVTADHGGHEYMHGTRKPEDMQIPLICIGEDFPPDKALAEVNICDIAPTITKLEGVSTPKDWKGKSLV